MLRYIVPLVCLICLENVGGLYHKIDNEVIEDQEMVLAFVVNRHGERSPDENELSLSDQQEKIRNLTSVEGFEGLTNAGKRRAYQIGKFIRQRYGTQGHRLISNLYRKEEIYLRSTDKERTKMTIQIITSAVYPPEEQQTWDEGIGKIWQPVPYNTIPHAEDYLRFYFSCKSFKNLMDNAKASALQEEFAPYSDLIPIIQSHTGRNFTEDPTLFQALMDLYNSQIKLGLDLPEWAKPLLPRLKEAARLAYNLYFRSDEMKKLGGGVMINDFITAAKDIAAGKEVARRLRLYSAHDFNVGALMAVTKVTTREDSIPEYGSVFALELYKSRRTGKLSVAAQYLPQAGDSSVQKLHFEGCENETYCDFSIIEENSRPYVMSEKDFYQHCGIRTELVFEDHLLVIITRLSQLPQKNMIQKFLYYLLNLYIMM